MSPVCAVPPTEDFKVVIVSASGAVPEIVTVSPDLSIERATALEPPGTEPGGPTAILISSVPVPDPPAVNLNVLVLELIPSTALMAYIVLSFGVTTLPPRAIEEPLIVRVEFDNALFGILVNVLLDPEIILFSKVLLVNVCVCVKYTSPGESQNTVAPSLLRYLPAPVSPLTTIPLPVNSKLSPDTISSIFFEIALTINGKRSAI